MYSSMDLDLNGEDVLEGVAPTACKPDSNDMMQSSRVWVDFAGTMLAFAMVCCEGPDLTSEALGSFPSARGRSRR